MHIVLSCSSYPLLKIYQGQIKMEYSFILISIALEEFIFNDSIGLIKLN